MTAPDRPDVALAAALGVPAPDPADPRGHVDLGAFLDITPLDDALEGFFEEAGVPRPGGPSGKGWSSRSELQACPYRYYLQRVAPPRLAARILADARKSPALEIGSLFHQLLAHHYLARLPGKDQEFWLKLTEESDTFLQYLREKGVSGEVIQEARRLYEAYTMRYESDYLRPVAVEARFEDDHGLSCRFDLLAEVIDNPLGIPKGLWNVEHKTCSRFDDATLTGWQSDGEILGQMLVFDRLKLHRRFGPLQGVIVNLISKTKVPGFHRTFVPIRKKALRQHAKDLKVFEAVENVYRATGTWPRSRAACIGRYGKCQFFDHCATS